MNRLRPHLPRSVVFLALVLLRTHLLMAQQRYPGSGLLLKIDRSHLLAVISSSAISGYMDAKKIQVSVPSASDFANLRAGGMVDFTLVVNKQAIVAESLRTHVYQGLEPDPAAARRLKLLSRGAEGSAKPLAIGDKVPNFTLTGQDGAPLIFSRFRGKVIALNFVYTRCALPNFCLRSSNNFSSLQERFRNNLKKDLVLMTVTFDPVHDSPEALTKYALKFNADPSAWHFLTGSEDAIRRVCGLFGEDYFFDEGLMDHSLHTAIIDRQGRLQANLEGNEFSARQLADFVETVLSKRSPTFRK